MRKGRGRIRRRRDKKGDNGGWYEEGEEDIKGRGKGGERKRAVITKGMNFLGNGSEGRPGEDIKRGREKNEWGAG